MTSSATVSLSSSLKAACEPKTHAIYPENGGGMDFVRVWQPPMSVTPDMREDALNTLRRLDVAMTVATEDLVRKWLTVLGNLVASRHGADEAHQAVRSYATMLDYPCSCFTRDTLRDAAKRFKFWPAFAELAEFLDALVADQRALRDRLEALCRVPLSDAPPPANDALAPLYRDLDAERQAEHDRLMAGFRARMAEGPREAPKPPPETAGQRHMREQVAELGRQWHRQQESQGKPT